MARKPVMPTHEQRAAERVYCAVVAHAQRPTVDAGREMRLAFTAYKRAILAGAHGRRQL